jgi:multidrug resistance efflux pump
LLRAAAVGGTAYAVGRRGGRQREEAANAEADQDQRIADLEQQQAAPAQAQQPPPPAAPAQGPSMLDQLNQLNELHQQGALSDEEFTAAKAKLLGS